MKLSTNVVSQMLAILIQAANQFTGIVPPAYQAYIVLGVGIAQLLIGFMAHYSNTDGTPQAVAFNQPKAAAAGAQ